MGHPVPEGNKYGDLALKVEGAKYVEFCGTSTQE
jgi:hypothetical protein